MSRPPTRPTALRGTVFRGSAAVADGVLTRRQLDGKSWRRLYRDVYADAAIPHSHQLALRGALLVIPASAVISGRSAAHLWGAAMSEPTGPVAIWSPHPFGPIRGITIHVSPMPKGCVTMHRGLPVCTPEHAAWEIAWSLPLFEAIGWIDALARRRHLARARLVEHCVAHPSARGRGVARDLAWPALRFAVEYDGQWHADRDQLTATADGFVS